MKNQSLLNNPEWAKWATLTPEKYSDLMRRTGIYDPKLEAHYAVMDESISALGAIAANRYQRDWTPVDMLHFIYAVLDDGGMHAGEDTNEGRLAAIVGYLAMCEAKSLLEK